MRGGGPGVAAGDDAPGAGHPAPTGPTGGRRRAHDQHHDDDRDHEHHQEDHASTPSSTPSLRPQRYSVPGNASRSPPQRPGRRHDIDAVDQQLIDLLRANGRASYAELARQVGLSSPAVTERVAKLEASGVITGYRAVVDPRRSASMSPR